MEYQMQQEKTNNMTSHLQPPSPMREVHSIKLTSVTNTPVKSNYIPERLYMLSRNSASALRRTTPLRRNSSPYISSGVRESPLFNGRYKNKNNERNNNNIGESMPTCNSPLIISNNVFAAPLKENKIREAGNDNNINIMKKNYNTKRSNNKFIEQVHGKYGSAVVDCVSNSNDNSNSINAVNEVKHNSSTAEKPKCKNNAIHNNGSLRDNTTTTNNNANSIVTQLKLEDESGKVDDKIQTSKHCILIPSSALESIRTRTPRRVHTVCQSEQISSIAELYAKRESSTLAATAAAVLSSNATPLQRYEHSKCSDKETDHCLLHHLQTHQGTVENEGKTPLRRKMERTTRKDGKQKSSNHYTKLDCSKLQWQQQKEEEHEQYQYLPQECTPLHSRFLTRKMRSLSAHDNKFEIKLNELREMHTQRLQLLDSQEREQSAIQTSHCTSYSRHTAPSVASEHSELARPAKPNLERVSRRIFSPDSKDQRVVLECEELGQEGKKKIVENKSSNRLSYFERNQFQHRVRSSSSHTSRSADSLARHENKLPFNRNNKVKQSVTLSEEQEQKASREELSMSLLRESKQELSQLSETPSRNARGLWSFLHRQSFEPGANAFVAKRSAMLRSTSLQPYCSNGFYRREPHRRGSNPALETNFDNTSQEQQEEEETSQTNQQFEEERVNENAGLNAHERKNTKDDKNKTNVLQYNDNKLNISNSEVDKSSTHLESNTSAHVQHRMERVERTATATPTSVLVPHGPPRLSSDYNDSDDDNDNTINDDDDDDDDNNKHFIENDKVVLPNDTNIEDVEEKEEIHWREDHNDSTENSTFTNKKSEVYDSNSCTVSSADIANKETVDAVVSFENECASSHSPFTDEMYVELQENSTNYVDSEWTDTPLSQKGTRETSEAPTLPYTKSPSREFDADNLLHSPYPEQNAYVHTKVSSQMNSAERSDSRNTEDAEYVDYEPNDIQTSLFNEESNVNVV